MAKFKYDAIYYYWLLKLSEFENCGSYGILIYVDNYQEMCYINYINRLICRLYYLTCVC